MRKLLLFVILFISSFIYSQCKINELHKDILGKDTYSAKQILYGYGITNIHEDNFSYNLDFDYLRSNAKRNFFKFVDKNNSCFDGDITYNVTTVNDIVYKISIEKKYDLYSFNDYENDYKNIVKCVLKSYPILENVYNLSKKFNYKRDSGSYDTKKVGHSYYYYKIKTTKAKIFKVNYCNIIKEEEYTLGNEGGYKLPQTGFILQIDFVNLNNTVLDNRGY